MPKACFSHEYLSSEKMKVTRITLRQVKQYGFGKSICYFILAWLREVGRCFEQTAHMPVIDLIT